MYDIFATDIISGNRNLWAEIANPTPYNHNPQPHWFLAEPLATPIPHLVYSVPHKLPLRDNYWAGGLIQIYSSRLLSLLEKAGVRFEHFPVTLIDRKTQSIVSEEYGIFHLLEKRPAFDKEKCWQVKPELIAIFNNDTLSETERDAKAVKLSTVTLRPEIMQNPTPLFRAAEVLNVVFIHHDLKAILEAHEITGCLYKPLHQTVLQVT